MPRLEDPPLLLRSFNGKDVPLIQEASADPLIPLITTVPRTTDATAALAFVERQHSRVESGQGYSFAVADSTTGEAVGQIGALAAGPVGGTSNRRLLDCRLTPSSGLGWACAGGRVQLGSSAPRRAPAAAVRRALERGVLSGRRGSWVPAGGAAAQLAASRGPATRHVHVLAGQERQPPRPGIAQLLGRVPAASATES